MSETAHKRDTTRPWALQRANTWPIESDAYSAPVARKRSKVRTKALECLICMERYSRDDVLTGLYRIETKVCSECYSRMQAAHHSKSCFAKPDFILLDGTRLLGYSPTARECRELCPDRTLCASVANPATYNPPLDEDEEQQTGC